MYPRTAGIDKAAQHAAAMLLFPKRFFSWAGTASHGSVFWSLYPAGSLMGLTRPTFQCSGSLPHLLTWLVLSLHYFRPLCLYQRIKVMENIQPYLQCQKFASFRNRLKGFRCLLFSLLFWLPCRYVNQFVNVPYKMHEPVILTNTQSSFVISS